LSNTDIGSSELELTGSVQRDLFTGTRDKAIGLEVEVFLRPAEGEGLHRAQSIGDLLETIAVDLGGEYSTDVHGGPRVVLPSGGILTLEPAGQLEYSGAPCGNAAEAVETALGCIESMRVTAHACGWRLWHEAFDTQPAEPSLVVWKPRYLAMDAHFQRIGPFGRMMMRRTCALQVNLDFGPVGVDQERWRLANMVAPALNAMFANSPYVYEGRSYSSFRYEVWRRTDPTRTGRLFDRPDLDPVLDYTRFALDATVMMIQTPAGTVVPDSGLSFRQWMVDGWRGHFPRSDDWTCHLSTLFPDVRPKGWIEIRSIDAQPPGMMGPVVAFVSALLYDDGARRSALALLEHRRRYVTMGEEHGGHWSADLCTAVDVLNLTLDAVVDLHYRAQLEEHLRTLRRQIPT